MGYRGERMQLLRNHVLKFELCFPSVMLPAVPRIFSWEPAGFGGGVAGIQKSAAYERARGSIVFQVEEWLKGSRCYWA